MQNHKPYTILYIDDEPSNLKTFRATFKWDYNILLAESGKQGLEILEGQPVDLIISDQRMPEMTGFEFFKSIVDTYPEPIRIVLTGYSDMGLLIRSINECGIYQYLTKPWTEDEMKHVLDKALETYQLRKDNRALIEDLKAANAQLKEENYYLKEEIKTDYDFNNIITKNDRFKQILKGVERVAVTPTTVLIRGESGTGKELLAGAIHNISERKQHPLVKVNCAALPENLIESELFGHKKGAFTGAVRDRKGRFELADHGTIFLDEIGEMPLEIQVKLLRVLQESEFQPVGGEKSIRVNVRVIAATNLDLEAAIDQGKFREDLYYRLNVFPINVPALRERKEDIPLLVKHFLQKYEPILGKKFEKVATKSMEMMMAYEWPGNIRELENIVERSMILSDGSSLQVSGISGRSSVHKDKAFLTLAEAEKKQIIEALERTKWKVSGRNGAAELLDINPKTLFTRMEKLGIKRYE